MRFCSDVIHGFCSVLRISSVRRYLGQIRNAIPDGDRSEWSSSRSILFFSCRIRKAVARQWKIGHRFSRLRRHDDEPKRTDSVNVLAQIQITLTGFVAAARHNDQLAKPLPSPCIPFVESKPLLPYKLDDHTFS